MMACSPTGRRLPPRIRGTWGPRHLGNAWPPAAGGMGTLDLMDPQRAASRLAAETVADVPRPAVPRRRQSTTLSGLEPWVGQRPVSRWP